MPNFPSTSIQSFTLNGLVVSTNNPDAKLPKLPCNDKPIAKTEAAIILPNIVKSTPAIPAAARITETFKITPKTDRIKGLIVSDKLLLLSNVSIKVIILLITLKPIHKTKIAPIALGR